MHAAKRVSLSLYCPICHWVCYICFLLGFIAFWTCEINLSYLILSLSSCLVTGVNGVYWKLERHSENALKVERANKKH